MQISLTAKAAVFSPDEINTVKLAHKHMCLFKWFVDY